MRDVAMHPLESWRKRARQATGPQRSGSMSDVSKGMPTTAGSAVERPCTPRTRYGREDERPGSDREVLGYRGVMTMVQGPSVSTQTSR